MKMAKQFSKLVHLSGLIAFAVFCALAAWIWVPPAAAPTIQTSAPAKTLSARVEDGVQNLADLVPVTTQRPLFHASRKPAQTAAPAPAPAAPERTLSLVGVLGEDGTQIALVRMSGSSELFRVDAGGQIGPWQILMIGDSFVQVSKDQGDPFTLSIGE